MIALAKISSSIEIDRRSDRLTIHVFICFNGAAVFAMRVLFGSMGAVEDFCSYFIFGRSVSWGVCDGEGGGQRQGLKQRGRYFLGYVAKREY
jgi:hypothetical protein